MQQNQFRTSSPASARQELSIPKHLVKKVSIAIISKISQYFRRYSASLLIVMAKIVLLPNADKWNTNRTE